jgi:hypothetical protein
VLQCGENTPLTSSGEISRRRRSSAAQTNQAVDALPADVVTNICHAAAAHDVDVTDVIEFAVHQILNDLRQEAFCGQNKDSGASSEA